MGRLQVIWHLIDTIVEIGILWILYIEFNYDKIQDEKREYKETQKKKKRTKVEQSVLREGTGAVLPETTGLLCDMRESPKPIQTPPESGSQP